LQNSAVLLGSTVSKAFANKLPFLFKVLSAGKPLSLQAHPTLEQAKSGFEKENRAGIDLSAPNRNYKDDNHKPELICAITPFKALNGFRDLNEIITLMMELDIPSLKESLDAFRKEPDKKGLKDFYSRLMRLDALKKETVVSQARESARSKQENPVFKEILNLDGYFPGDIGILAPLLLNLVTLKPGEAMYLEAGQLHAYIEGTGMELMANSDNVLRGGLTPKHIDVEELLGTLSYFSGAVSVLQPLPTENSCEMRYPSPAEEFAFSVLPVEDFFQSQKEHSVEILFCAKGSGTISITGTGQQLSCEPGSSYLVPAGVSIYEISGKATFYKATVPRKSTPLFQNKEPL
ncbi:MAG: mannose-6-phosphate isomerase, class I, partial [bacterium]|nr:mannose-6-phosphate isomerase, class I [bacterium]